MTRESWIGTTAAVVLLATVAPAMSRDLRAYGPSTLLVPGESELKIFNNLYTQTAFFDDDGNRVDQGARSTWYTGTAALRVGWTPRVNAGVEITVRAVKDGTRLPDFQGRSGLTAVTPRLQFAPFSGTRWLTLQAGVRFPLGSDLEGDSRDPFLDFAHPAFVGQILCDHPLSGSFRLYAEVGGFARMAGDESQLTTPLKAIVNFEPSSRWTLYLPVEASPEWLGDSSGNYFTQVGLGGKIRPGTGAELEALWTVFPMGRNAGAGQTFNVGIRFVR